MDKKTFYIYVSFDLPYKIEDIEKVLSLKRDDEGFEAKAEALVLTYAEDEKNLYFEFEFEGEFSFIEAEVVDTDPFSYFVTSRWSATIEADNEFLYKVNQLIDHSDDGTGQGEIWLDLYTDQGTITIKSDNLEDLKELINLANDTSSKKEQFYDLPDLGLEIGARTQKIDFLTIQNRIVLRKKVFGANEGIIECVHTAIMDTTLDEYDEDMILNVTSSEGKRVDLSFEEHFFALKSLVQAISEFGLLKIMRESYDYSEMNFGFNSLMHQQFIVAISKIDEKLAHEITKNFLLEILESMQFEIAKKWLMDRLTMICTRFNIYVFKIRSQFEVSVFNTFTEARRAYVRETISPMGRLFGNHKITQRDVVDWFLGEGAWENSGHDDDGAIFRIHDYY